MKHYSLSPANFGDYRDFLISRFEEIQQKNKRFSLQACANRAKISKSLLQFLFQKKRHVGLDKIPALARSLKLSADEEYFVCLMLCKSSSRNPEVQAHFEGILNRIRHQYVRVEAAEPASSTAAEKALYLNVLFMIFQTLVRLPGFQEDVGWIMENLKLPELNPEIVRTALGEVERLGFVKRDTSGRLTAGEEALWRPDPYDPSGQSVFTACAEALAELMKAPDRYRPSVYMSMALSFDEEHLLAAEKRMIELHHELVSLSIQSKNPSAVAFIGNFFLTVARLKMKN